MSELKVNAIQSTTGNNALLVADGVMTPSVKHAFYMYRSSYSKY